MAEEEGELLDEGLRVYGLEAEDVFAYRFHQETGELVIVTRDGRKIRHRKGESAKVILPERHKKRRILNDGERLRKQVRAYRRTMKRRGPKDQGAKIEG